MLGLSFCHLKYFYLKSSFSLVKALNLLSNRVKYLGSLMLISLKFGSLPSEPRAIVPAKTGLSVRLVKGSIVPTD